MWYIPYKGIKGRKHHSDQTTQEMATTNQSTNEAIKKVEDQITCPICMERFTDPRVLPCFHSYCLTCLQRVLVESNNSLPCPTCRSPCPVPDKGLASLPPSFVVNNLVEVYDLMKKASAHQYVPCNNCDNTNADSYCKQCATFLCPECLPHHNKWKPNAGHQILSLDEVASTAHQLPRAKQDLKSCTDHNKPLDLFCESCQQLICDDCIVKKHKDHNYDLVTDTYRQRKDAIDQSCLQPLKEEYDRLVAAQKILTSNRNEIPRNAQATNDEIWQAINQIKNRLDETGKTLTQKVDSVAQYKVGVFDQQLKEVDTALGQVAECRDHVDQCVNVGSPQQLLLTTPQIMSHTQSVIDSVKDKTFQPLEQPDIQLVKSDTIPQIHESIGEVKCTFHLDKVTLSRRHIPLINQESTVTIALSVLDGFPAPVPPSFINCRLTPPDNSPPILCSVKESSQSGQYSVVFTPLTRGIHQLHVTVNGGNISGSPVSVPVSVPPNMRGTPVKTITGLNRPRGVAVTDDGLVIVSEEEGHCITILDSEGRKIRSIGTQGEGRGQLYYPQGVAITSKGTILVADLGNDRIQEFTMEGDCISCVGTEGTGPLQFSGLRGITINKTTGQVFVVDMFNHRVQVLHPDLTFSHMFGSKGSRQGQFESPYDVAIDSQGYVYVTEYSNHRVQQFTPEGQFVTSFGTGGSEPGQLYYPTGITLDDNDLVYVNNENQFISVHTTNGQYITHIEKSQPEDSSGYYAGIIFDTNGDLYTSSTEAQKLFVY